MLDYVRPYASVTTELMKKKLNKKKKKHNRSPESQ